MILSIDPGINIGMVLGTDIDLITPDFSIARAGVIMYPNRAQLKPILARYRAQLTAIVLEDFKLFPHKAVDQIGSRFETVKVIERVTVYCEELGLDHLITMQPSSAQQRVKVPDDVPAQLGYNRHLLSAYKHLRYYLFAQKA